jgi:hypothetical protein
MNLSGNALRALAIALLASLTAGGTHAQQQDDSWNKIDLKPLVPQFVPILPPLPQNSQLSPGGVGGAVSPYSAPALQDSLAPAQPGAGLRLTVPTR